MGCLTKNNAFKSFVAFLPGLLFFNIDGSAQNATLQVYIKEGLENNLALQQKKDDYSKSIEVLREAKGMFFPSVSLNARYTTAQGGRVIEFPLGDLFNPVYQSLNQLTGEEFPTLENEEFPFFRPREQETKIQVIQPLINTQLYFNRKIQSELTETDRTDAEIYKSYLIREIKTAYYNYLKAGKLYLLLENTRLLLEENIRVNESLFANDKVTADVLLRSQSELSKLEMQLTESEKMIKTSAAYFNFLLNRPFDAEIITDNQPEIEDWLYTIPETMARAVENRDELMMLQNYTRIADLNYKMNQYNKIPSLLGVAEYGYQGEKYGFTVNSDYLLASVIFRWNIFSGFQNNAKIQQARIQQDITEKQYAETKSKIELEVIQSWYDLQASRKSIDASKKLTEALTKAFDLVRKKYKEGQVSLIEFMDARTAMTNADESLIISQYDYLIKMAELERVSGYDHAEDYTR